VNGGEHLVNVMQFTPLREATGRGMVTAWRRTRGRGIDAPEATGCKRMRSRFHERIRRQHAGAVAVASREPIGQNRSTSRAYRAVTQEGATQHA
jgi:hypothetical protein